MLMIILFHVVVALSSIVMTSLAGLFPSVTKLRIGAVLIGVTLISGTYLVFSLHSSLMQSCVTGLAYLAVTLAGMVVGNYRLATAKQIR
jgi:hypothetical protein